MKRLRFILLLIFALLSRNAVNALEIETVKIGFAGQYYFKHVNPVSLKIHNPANEAYDGVIGLSGSRTSGTKIVKEFYIPPHTSQWVHFYPYYSEYMNEFDFLWGKSLFNHKRIDVKKSTQTQPIYLSRGGLVLSGSVKMAQYPTDFFPPMLSALDALKVVVLDHNPRWQKVRRKVFRDWVYKGGTLHLFHDNTGNYPVFTAELAGLNNPLESFSFGGGKVFKHPHTSKNITNSYVKEKLLTHLELNSFLKGVNEDKTANNQNNVYGNQDVDFLSYFFQSLRSLTRAEHNWGLIYFLSFIYLLAIFPGTLIMGRKRIDYKIIYASILILVGMMSFTFWKIGQRGYNEKTILNVVSVAHSLGNGRYDLKSWNSAFVTTGDDYQFESNGEGLIYTTGAGRNYGIGYDRSSGKIVNGTGGFYEVDIPPFTARTYSCQASFDTGKTLLKLARYSAGDDLNELKISLNHDTEFELGSAKASVYYNGKMYGMKNAGGVLEALPNSAVPLKKYIMNSVNKRGFSRYRYNYNRGLTGTAEIYKEMREPLICSTLGISNEMNDQNYNYATLKIPSQNIARVYMYASSIKEFQQTTEGIGEQKSRVLYVIDFDLTEKK